MMLARFRDGRRVLKSEFDKSARHVLVAGTNHRSLYRDLCTSWHASARQTRHAAEA
jgi:hypothetical protein